MISAIAPAKINLGLQILRRRSDGFHDLSTVFHPIDWADTLSASLAENLRLTCSDPTLPTDSDNLVVRAGELLQISIEKNYGAHVHLEKVLPHGAGLGGGSSNAATTLRLLCNLWDVDIQLISLASLALRLGSDVPFFLSPTTTYAEGRGEKLVPMRGYAFPFYIAIVVYPIHISTAWAFQQVKPSSWKRHNLAEIVQSNDLDRWKRELENDFETPIFHHYPILRKVKSVLLQNGAGFATLTGTGSGVYGVFESYEDACKASEEAATQGCRIFVSKSKGREWGPSSVVTSDVVE